MKNQPWVIKNAGRLKTYAYIILSRCLMWLGFACLFSLTGNINHRNVRLVSPVFYSEDLFCISTLSHGRHTSKTAAKGESHIVKPARVHAPQRENVEYSMLPASLKEVTLLTLGND